MPFRSIASNPTHANSYVLNKPAGGVDGDVFPVVLHTDTSSATAANFAALGFTSDPNSPAVCTADGMVFYAGYKVAASEPANYTFTNGNFEDLIGEIVALSGMTGALHRSWITVNNGSNASPWTATSAAFPAGVTTVACTVVVFVAHDVKAPGASVVGTEPAGYTKQGGDVTDGLFFNVFTSTKDSVAAGFDGVLSAIGTAAAAQSGWVIAVMAFEESGGGGSPTVTPTGFGLTASLGTPVVTSTAIVKTPTGFGLTASLGTPSVNTGSNPTIQPTGFGLVTSLGTFTTQSDITLTGVTGFGLTVSRGTPSVNITSGVTLTPTGFALTVTRGTPTVTLVNNPTVLPTGFSLTASLGTPSINNGSNPTVTPSGFSLLASLGTPSLLNSGVVRLPVGFALGVTLGTPSIQIPGAPGSFALDRLGLSISVGF